MFATVLFACTVIFWASEEDALGKHGTVVGRIHNIVVILRSVEVLDGGDMTFGKDCRVHRCQVCLHVL